MKTHRPFNRPALTRSLCALGLGLCAPLGCASESVDLGGGNVAQQLRRGTRCADSPIVEGDVRVTSQADVAALEGCQEVRGALTIQLFAAADLSPLHALTAVDGTLVIGQEAAQFALFEDDVSPEEVEALAARDLELIEGGWLESLSGLESLERTGSLMLSYTSVTDLTGLEQLRIIGGPVSTGNAGAGVAAGSLTLAGNRNLRDLSGLENARGVDLLNISSNPSLLSLSGFVAEPVLSAVSIAGSPALVDLEALSPVVQLNGLFLSDLGIEDLSALTSLQNVASLGIGANDALTDVGVLGKLAECASITISGNAALRRLPSFAQWLRVPDEVWISDNPLLERVDLDFGGFSNSQTVGERLHVFPSTSVNIANNALLSSVSVPAVGSSEPAAGLVSVNFFLLRDNPGLSSLDFGGLRRAGLLSIANNPSLDSVTLGSLARVEELEVTNNPQLSAAAFDGVATFERTLSGNLP